MNRFKLWASARSGAALAALAAGTLLALGLAAPGTVQAQPQAGAGWQRCAGQDEICRFEGQALVRYGAGGRYAYKVGVHRLICDQYEFGDPAFGQVKQCEFNPDVRARPRDADSDPDWVPCATEGDTCRFNGNARVRYGAEPHYVYRNASNSILCSVDVFGDPAFGTPKRCEYQLHRHSGGIGDDAGWDYCASEGGVCRFSGPAEVRYGAKGRFVSKRAINGMPCSVEAFGRDPIYGEPKHCYVRQGRP
jgi:hypothetical protein